MRSLENGVAGLDEHVGQNRALLDALVADHRGSSLDRVALVHPGRVGRRPCRDAGRRLWRTWRGGVGAAGGGAAGAAGAGIRRAELVTAAGAGAASWDQAPLEVAGLCIRQAVARSVTRNRMQQQTPQINACRQRETVQTIDRRQAGGLPEFGGRVHGSGRPGALPLDQGWRPEAPDRRFCRFRRGHTLPSPRASRPLLNLTNRFQGRVRLVAQGLAARAATGSSERRRGGQMPLGLPTREGAPPSGRRLRAPGRSRTIENEQARRSCAMPTR